MFNTFIYNTTVRNIEDLCLAPFGYAIQLIGDMSYVIRMLPLDSTGRERASERSESPLQAPGFDPSQKQTVEPTRKSKLNKGVHVNASIEKQEKNPGNGSQVQPKEPLMTRLLRWIYPDQRHASRHSVPPLVAYLGTAKTSPAYRVGDISAAGFYMVTRERWLPGTEMPVTLQRTDTGKRDFASALTVLATVVRTGIDGVGFSFVAASTDVAHDEQHSGMWASREDLDQFLHGIELSEPGQHDLERAS